jgi:alkyldihydroxyacetonephosphate synthase
MITGQSTMVEETLQSLRDVLGDAVSTGIADRIAYAHDASPIALRQAAAGTLPHLPDAVAWPRDPEQVAATLRWAQATRTPVTPYGGGSGIVGGALPVAGGLVIDLKRMNRIRAIDETSLVATVESGINGQILEDRLQTRGYTLGHLPQSIRASTLGGWIAHRAAGVTSTRYGKIEDIVEALEIVLPTGEMLTTRAVPRSSTGPDLDQLFLGAEGTYGIVTAAHLAIHHAPETRAWQAYAFPGFDAALDCIRRVIQQELRPAIVRLYDAAEAIPHLAGMDLPEGTVLLLWGSEGSRELVEFELAGMRRTCQGAGVVDLGPDPGDRWWNHRLSTAALLRTLRQPASISDALEVTGSWAQLGAIYQAMKSGMLAAAGAGGRVYGHVSHVYQTGANLYMIFHAQAEDESAVPALYDRILDAAFTACLERGGSLSHHHGVGSTKARWLPDEHGETGLRLLRQVQGLLDPAGIMNPAAGFHRAAGGQP